MVHRRTVGQDIEEFVERRRSHPLARCVPGILGEIAQGQHPAPTAKGEARRTVHGEEVEEDRITGLEVCYSDVEGVTVSLDYRR